MIAQAIANTLGIGLGAFLAGYAIVGVALAVFGPVVYDLLRERK